MSEDLFGTILGAWSTLLAESDYEKLLEGITQISRSLTSADHASITLKEGRKLKYAYSTDIDRSIVSTYSISMGEGFIGKVAQDLTPISIRREEGLDQSPNAPGASGIKIQTILCVPMILRQSIFGTVQVFNKTNADVFSEQDISRLQLFANQAALALERFALQDRFMTESRRVRGIFEALTDGIMVVDAEGNPIIYNKAVETLFFPDGKQNYALTTYLSTLLRQDVPTGIAEVFLLKPHNIILSNRYVVVKDADGKTREVILSIRNITDQSGIDRRFSQFYAFLLRHSNRVLNRFKRTKDRRQRRKLLKRHKEILRNLVYLTELKSGPLRIEKDLSVIADIIESVLARFRKRFANAGINVFLPSEEMEVQKVRLEPGRFVQVFRAIFQKGLSFLPKNSGSEIRLDSENKNNRIFISVLFVGKDVETHISPTTLQWNAQIDRVISGDTKRIDFDLALARHIIQAHKGNLQVFSPEPHRAQISFDIPLE